MKKINILLLGVGGNVTQGILAVLNKKREQYNVIGACISEESIGLYMCDKSYISPLASEATFIKWLIDICNKEKIDIIFTGVEEIIFKIIENEEFIKNSTKAIFIGSSLEKLKIGNDKLKTCEWLKENNLNYPYFADGNKNSEIQELIKKVGFPLIAKPKNGKGSQGINILNSYDQLTNIEELDKYVIQEYLGSDNEEYTVGCYSNKEGKTQDIIIMKRKLKYGTTFMAEIVQNELVYQEARKICDLFQPKGPLNIQMRVHNNKAICFELNVRFSGTTPFRAEWGYNDVEAIIQEYIFNENIEGFLNPLKSAKGYRYFNEIYIDLEMERNLKKNNYSLNTGKNKEEKRIK